MPKIDDEPERIHGFSPQVENEPNCLNAELVYAITDGAALKIGKSNGHPAQRLRELQTGNPRLLTLLAYTVGMTEAQAHRKFSRFRLRGDWFELCSQVLEELKNWDWVSAELTALERQALRELV